MKYSNLLWACLLISTEYCHASKNSLEGVEELSIQQEKMLKDKKTQELVKKSIDRETYVPPCHYEYIQMLNACYVYQRMRDEDTCCISKTIDYNNCFEKLPRHLKMEITGYSYYN